MMLLSVYNDRKTMAAKLSVVIFCAQYVKFICTVAYWWTLKSLQKPPPNNTHHHNHWKLLERFMALQDTNIWYLGFIYRVSQKQGKSSNMLISREPNLGISNVFFSPENWDPYAHVEYSNIFERCLGAEIFKKQNQGTLDRKGPSRVPPWSKLTNYFT